MIFDTLYIQNFMSIRTAEIKLDGQGMVLITGENKDNPDFDNNGAGKSSIIEALSYVLYGRTIRGLKGDDVVNRTVNRNCKVMIDIIDDDGTQYRVSRYRKHNVNKNKFCLHRNSVDITPKSEADFTKAISDLLQMDYLSFTSSILYSAQSFKFSTSTDAEMKSAFDAMLGFDLYTKYLEETKAEIKEKKDSQTQLQYEQDKIQTKLETEKSNLEIFTGMLNDFEDKKEQKIQDLTLENKKLSKELLTWEEKDEQETASIDDIDHQLETIESQIQDKEKSSSSLEELKKEIEECKSDIMDCDKKISSINNKIYKAEVSKSSVEEQLEKLSKQEQEVILEKEDILVTVGTPCPTCGRPLDSSHIQDAVESKKKEIQDIHSEIEDLTVSIQSYTSKISDYTQELSNAEQEKSDIEEDLSDLEGLLSKHSDVTSEISQLNAKYHALSNDLRALNKTNSKTKHELAAVSSRMDQIMKEISETMESDNPYAEKIDACEKAIYVFTEDWNSLETAIGELSKDINLLNFWLEGFSNSGIKSLLLDDITPYLNRRANKYLHKLSSNHMEIIFSTQSVLKSGEKREKFNIEIKNHDGGNSYLSNSSGERRRIDIAINLALQDLVASRSNKKLNIMFLDEVMDTLDESGVSNVMELIKDISAGKSSVFIISHNEEIKSMFTNVIKVTKENGCSTVEVL